MEENSCEFITFSSRQTRFIIQSFSIAAYPLQGRGVLELIPADSRQTVGFKSPVHHRADTHREKQPITLSRRQCMSLDCGRKLEYSERAHILCTERPCLSQVSNSGPSCQPLNPHAAPSCRSWVLMLLCRTTFTRNGKD